MTEKGRPHYALALIQKQMIDVPNLRLTNSALQCVQFELKWELSDVVALVQALKRGDFYKSMTTQANHRVWQDVYRPSWKGKDVYLKFQQGVDGLYMVISCKEL
jgi:motility quorum-sensing regulator / GCU-specific mRNA interferase toxin